MEIEFRLERPEDYRTVEELTREAFWGMHQPDCDEHCLVHKLRESSSFVPELDYVAEGGGQIVGHIIYSLAYVEDESGKRVEVLNFGPVSIRPDLQNQGIGKKLLQHTIAEAKRLGYRGIVFFGHPDYYPKVGFRRASEFMITDGGGTARDALMAMPLYEGALDGVKGRYQEDAAFDISKAEKEAYDRGFPPKEKCVMASAEELAAKMPADVMDGIRRRKIAHLADFTMYSQREVTQWDEMTEEAIEIIRDTLRTKGIRWGV